MRTDLEPVENKARVRCDDALMEAHALIDWEGLRGGLVEVYRREINQNGEQKPIDPVIMFKAVLLGQWHSLSNPKLEEALHMRTDFMDFCGVGGFDDAPDETMLCRFRNRLITSGKLAGILAGVNAELQANGIVIKNSHSPATAPIRMQSPPFSTGDTMSGNPNIAEAPKADEIAGKSVKMTIEYPKLASFTKIRHLEPDATWVGKNRKKYSGYVSYASVANDDSYIPRSAHGGQQK
ncbi:transposase [Nitrosospira sp. NpAV]|uniref:transposase n=1 Tax=Nitrosospira sp. NpAV TaxID=58133 RepID=UPI000697001C|nr:transposase [Nitrosospira sp. NpAV]